MKPPYWVPGSLGTAACVLAVLDLPWLVVLVALTLCFLLALAIRFVEKIPPAENNVPNEDDTEYGRVPSRFQLGETVKVNGRRVRIVGVTFRLMDFGDGWGIGPKVLYTVERSNGTREEVYSQEAYPAPKLVSMEASSPDADRPST